MTENEMAGWHHRLDGHEFEWAPGAGDGCENLPVFTSSSAAPSSRIGSIPL